MNGPERQPEDVRSLLGMNTPAAAALLAFYCAGLAGPAIIAVGHTRTHLWQSAVTVLVFWCAGIALLAVRGDPLPARPALAIAAAAPATSALVLLTPPPITYAHQNWPANVYTLMLTFLCVRGRTGFAVIAMAATVLVTTVWTTATGQGLLAALFLSLPNFGPLAMSTMFAYTIRPAAAKIFAARAQQDSAVRQIEKAARTRRELDKRLYELAEVARPLLERIGDGSRQLSPDHARACEALESQLSAILRGSGLVHEMVNPAADAARNRGVAVKMFDDGDLDELDEDVHERLLRGIAAELDEAADGEIIIRTVPRGRDELATVRAANALTVRKVSFDLSGTPKVPIVRGVE